MDESRCLVAHHTILPPTEPISPLSQGQSPTLAYSYGLCRSEGSFSPAYICVCVGGVPSRVYTCVLLCRCLHFVVDVPPINPHYFDVQLCVQCSPCKSNPDTTNFLLIRRFLESRHIYNTKNSNGMSCIIRSRVGLVYVHTREYQSFLITCVRLRYLRRPRSWS